MVTFFYVSLLKWIQRLFSLLSCCGWYSQGTGERSCPANPTTSFLLYTSSKVGLLDHTAFCIFSIFRKLLMVKLQMHYHANFKLSWNLKSSSLVTRKYSQTKQLQLSSVQLLLHHCLLNHESHSWTHLGIFHKPIHTTQITQQNPLTISIILNIKICLQIKSRRNVYSQR